MISAGPVIKRRQHNTAVFGRGMQANAVSRQRIKPDRQMLTMPLDGTKRHIHRRTFGQRFAQLCRAQILGLHIPEIAKADWRER